MLHVCKEGRNVHVYLHYCPHGLTSSKAARSKPSPGRSVQFQHRCTHVHMHPQPFTQRGHRRALPPPKHPRSQTRTCRLRFVFTPRSRGSRWTCSPCSKASVWWSRSPHSWCWLWIGATGWRSRRGRTGSGGPVRPHSAPLRSLVGTTGTFCSCCSSSCRARRKMALWAGGGDNDVIYWAGN